jgi:hypothetical protein
VADDKEVKNLLESAIATSEQQPSSQGIKQLDSYKVAMNDSPAMAKADKIKKRRDFIRKLAVLQCVSELDGTTSILVLPVFHTPSCYLT